MPDISMCMNQECPSHLQCYRFMAVPNPWRQSYMEFKHQEGKDRCESFVMFYEGKNGTP